VEKGLVEACAVLSFGEAVVVAVEVVVEDLVSLSCAAKSVRSEESGGYRVGRFSEGSFLFFE
jgi:hypothetical protein